MSISFNERKNWEARLQLEFGFTGHPAELPSECWTAEIWLPRRDAEQVRDAIEAVIHEHHLPYFVDDKRHRTSWGADSGEIVEVALFVARSAADALITSAIVALWQRLAKMGRDFGRHNIDRNEASERAKWLIASRYGSTTRLHLPATSSMDDLTIVGEIQDNTSGTWAISLVDTNGYCYRVTFAPIEGLVTSTKVERWHAASPRGPATGGS